MLGKQGWKFLTQPDTLVTKIFKARYFPNGDFLSAPKGNGPSYVWQSIRKSQSVVNRGSRWRIGDGSMVHVWGDQWLRDDNNLCISTAEDALLHGLRVCDLRIPNENAWDMDLIEAIFEERDAKEISNVPLGVGGNVDQRIWHYDKKGAYTVRSAYRVLMNYITPHEDLHVNGSWSDLWNLKVPPR
ncbi:Uncharacterized mitochondrial protein AtMg00310 [Linum perenne]